MNTHVERTVPFVRMETKRRDALEFEELQDRELFALLLDEMVNRVLLIEWYERDWRKKYLTMLPYLPCQNTLICEAHEQTARKTVQQIQTFEWHSLICWDIETQESVTRGWLLAKMLNILRGWYSFSSLVILQMKEHNERSDIKQEYHSHFVDEFCLPMVVAKPQNRLLVLEQTERKDIDREEARELHRISCNRQRQADILTGRATASGLPFKGIKALRNHPTPLLGMSSNLQPLHQFQDVTLQRIIEPHPYPALLNAAAGDSTTVARVLHLTSSPKVVRSVKDFNTLARSWSHTIEAMTFPNGKPTTPVFVAKDTPPAMVQLPLETGESFMDTTETSFTGHPDLSPSKSATWHLHTVNLKPLPFNLTPEITAPQSPSKRKLPAELNRAVAGSPWGE
eukprot:TRINITY_DN54341_c0_g2_i1.p1 TRINITY_DN54341_c0_g2~~TRINITY_DN54341_c0_g2_i1.p1  ORF type:complete len:397 (+),score=17.65 TRINITY_DN54341_c0_g2_i1:262-1452(+)